MGLNIETLPFDKLDGRTYDVIGFQKRHDSDDDWNVCFLVQFPGFGSLQMIEISSTPKSGLQVRLAHDITLTLAKDAMPDAVAFGPKLRAEFTVRALPETVGHRIRLATKSRADHDLFSIDLPKGAWAVLTGPSSDIPARLLPLSKLDKISSKEPTPPKVESARPDWGSW